MTSSAVAAATGPSGDDASRRDPLAIAPEVKASIRVLVVDDERTLRESCASVLQMDGYNVTVIGRGEEALEAVRRRRFDIILVDLYMSQVSGMDILQAALQAADHLRHLHPFFEVGEFGSLFRDPGSRARIAEGLRKAGLD